MSYVTAEPRNTLDAPGIRTKESASSGEGLCACNLESPDVAVSKNMARLFVAIPLYIGHVGHTGEFGDLEKFCHTCSLHVVICMPFTLSVKNCADIVNNGVLSACFAYATAKQRARTPKYAGPYAIVATVGQIFAYLRVTAGFANTPRRYS